MYRNDIIRNYVHIITRCNLELCPYAQGELYVFRVDVAASGTASTGFASSSLRANVPPVGGSFAVTPAKGSALSTTFTLKSHGWVGMRNRL